MINLKCRTEYSFRTAYGQPEKIIAAGGVGICDRHGTWGHVQFSKEAKKAKIKPVFGVELAVVNDADLKEKQGINYMSFLARNEAGLKNIYELTTLATEKTYYVPRLDYSHLHDISEDVIILSGVNPELGSLPRQPNMFMELSPVAEQRLYEFAVQKNLRCIATSDNFYPNVDDKRIYDIVAGDNRESRNKPMHILNEWEWMELFPYAGEQPLRLSEELYKECNVALPIAVMMHYDAEKSLLQLCQEGAKTRKCNLKDNLYSDRLNRELQLIKEKKFEDYFYVISDMVQYAKRHMLVGPARGSSCGSLVCYLLFITDIDPLPHNLLFERFIDITREDLPDIDIDFQDDRRELVFEYLRQKYGTEKVARLGTVARYKAKSTIIDVSKELSIAPWEVHDLKEAIIERSGGDSRAAFCILDTFQQLDIGKKTLEKFPELEIAAYIENHARQSGQHAAGVIVTAHPVTNYCSVDKRTGAAMIDKKDAEELNLLKIDALGLRTLSVLQDVLDSVNWTRDQLLAHPLNDEAAFQVIRDERFSGIFQFEGFALQNICRQMTIKEFNDIVAITALARPGPLTSGGTTEYIRKKTGQIPTTYLHPMMEKYTKNTYGSIVYQEQVMQICREVGKLSWEDVSTLRKALSKSFGKEYFDKFKERFIVGAKQNNIEEKLAIIIWEQINTMGSWAFNLSHSVAYGMVSYWCMVLKAQFPLEFAAACLRSNKSEEQVIQTIRELVNEGYNYKVFDKKNSTKNWAVIDGTLTGGLLNLKGCGDKMADDIIKRQKDGVPLTKRQESLMDAPITPYDHIFECKEKFKDMWDNPIKYNITSELSEIKDITDVVDAEYCFFGKIEQTTTGQKTLNVRDLNEAIFLQKRNGRRIETNTKMLNFIVSDDTGSIRVSIDRFKYEKLGKPIVESGQIGDWYLWKGNVRKGFLQVKIVKWRKL